MPVLIAGATGVAGRALARAIAPEGQVRAYVRRDDADLRSLGVHVAVGDLRHTDRLEAALEQVHTFVHLALVPQETGPKMREAIRDTMIAGIDAARNAEVRRLIVVTCAGADPSSADPYRAGQGDAEELVRESGLEHVVFRCAPFAGAGTHLARWLDRVRRSPVVVAPGNGRQRLNPISVRDVVAAIAAADRRDAHTGGVFELGGPETVTFDELIRLALGQKRIVHPPIVPGRTREAAARWAHDAVADPARAVDQFNLTLEPLRRALGAD